MAIPVVALEGRYPPSTKSSRSELAIKAIILGLWPIAMIASPSRVLLGAPESHPRQLGCYGCSAGTIRRAAVGSAARPASTLRASLPVWGTRHLPPPPHACVRPAGSVEPPCRPYDPPASRTVFLLGIIFVGPALPSFEVRLGPTGALNTLMGGCAGLNEIMSHMQNIYVELPHQWWGRHAMS